MCCLLLNIMECEHTTNSHCLHSESPVCGNMGQLVKYIAKPLPIYIRMYIHMPQRSLPIIGYTEGVELGVGHLKSPCMFTV